MELINLKGEYASKILDLEDKIEKLKKEIEQSKKNEEDLNVQLNEFKVNDKHNLSLKKKDENK